MAALYALHLASLALLLVFAFVPAGRAWAFRCWNHAPPWVPFVLFAVCGSLPLLASRLAAAASSSARTFSYARVSLALLACFGAAFVLFRARAHFLGDGYQILSRVGVPHIRPKFTSFGAEWIHFEAAKLWPDPRSAGLVTYQAIAVLAGLAFLVLAILFAKALFERLSQRLVFVLGMASSGTMLMFFGHVENYALFLTFNFATSLAALAVLRGSSRRLWILPPLVISVFLHVLGIVLVPGVLYALAHGSRWSQAIGRWSVTRRWLAASALLVAAAAPVVALSQRSLYFRLIVLPVLPTRFTVEGYTLFSPSHLLDFTNLVFLMLPGVAVVAALLLTVPRYRLTGSPASRYLLISLGTTALMAFLIDPKLGMPRDWDLYSPFGLHLALFAFWVLAEGADERRTYRVAALLAVILGWSVLGSRVAACAIPDLALLEFHEHIALDKTKSMNSRQLLYNHYIALGDSVRADQEHKRWNADYPERNLVATANRKRLQGALEEAASLSRRALQLNPMMYDAWTILGATYAGRGDYRGAIEIYRISDGLNPGNLFLSAAMAEAFFQLGELDTAERWWRKAIRIDPTSYHANYWLAQMCERSGRREEYVAYLVAAAENPNAPAMVMRELGDVRAAEGNREGAVQLYRQAIARGLDATEASGLRERYEELR